MSTRRKLLAGGLLLLQFGACTQRTGNTNTLREPTPGVIVKVIVYRTGRITLDGEPATLEAVKERFGRLKAEGGAVWYYRENPTAEPPPEATAVIQAVIDARLPIRLSSKPDFSDSIGFDGKPIKEP